MTSLKIWFLIEPNWVKRQLINIATPPSWDEGLVVDCSCLFVASMFAFSQMFMSYWSKMWPCMLTPISHPPHPMHFCLENASSQNIFA